MTSSPAPTVLPQGPPCADVTAAFPQVHRYLGELLDDYRPDHAHLRGPLRTLVEQGRQAPHEFSLPLLVHAALSGDPGPAVPVAAVHALWWRAANTFDDVADGDAGPQLYGMPSAAALTAALECGYALPLRALASLPVPGPQRQGLIRDYLDGWTAASDGQIGDLLNHPAGVEPQEVLHVYRHKSGSVYAMACAMAARLAVGQERTEWAAARIAAWTRFGQLLGMLAQFRNDEDDLRSGRCEDLRNGTATYLLVHLVHSAPHGRRERVLALLEASASSPESREELHAMMREPGVVRPYHAHVASLREEAHTLLDTLAPECPYGTALRARVEYEVGFLQS
ncbi:polyprenyl synthetase family protein [Streptomyces iconiensis]|uniref:Class 1 isoprenoid biosynthesis enzyme n=1 Tax=Streptomyces iconiensis TaxID=1384038 RepID=A0ABT7A9Q6_9ACTN|nr:class 1 isoprenoid biosynthesis enzyme [Streptomyces iconiensis]MDJ1138059.1 class 1 isoprenoid biosynthesis enzyme [Streptomyces iconiensis]